MCLLRELDRRRAALRDGYRSLREWATGRMDVAPETAAVLVSTARRLVDLPEVAEAVASGVIGFDRAVAVSRFAGRDDSCDVLSEIAGYDSAGIRRRAARRRRMSRLDEGTAFNGRCLVAEPNLDGSAWRFTNPDVSVSRPARRADALWSISLDSLAGGDGATIDLSTPLLTVFVDATETADTNGETGVQVEAGPQVGPIRSKRSSVTG